MRLTDAVGVGFGVAVAVVELSLILTVDGWEQFDDITIMAMKIS